MSVTNRVAAKFFGGVVALAMVATFAMPAHAQTTEELQQMINDLLAQVAALQAQLGDGGSMSGAAMCPYTWTRDLSEGSSGMDVMRLQQFLNADPDTRIAATGVGSAGQETEFFGALTGAAVAKFQQKYREDVLAPLGLVTATPFFGERTRAKANELCADGMMDDDDDDDDDDDRDRGGNLSGGESSLEDFNAKSGDDTDLEEGQVDAPVMEVEFDVEDGDVEIRRVDVAVDKTSSGSGEEENPWDVFDEISIWVDGDKVAEVDATDEDDWEEGTGSTGALQAGDYRLRITGLDLVYRENDTAEMTIGVTLQNSIDGNSGTWQMFIPDEGIRGRDGAGVDQYTGDTTDPVTFDFSEEGGDDELKVRSSSADPDATTIEVEENDKSSWVTIFAFDLDTDDSVNDIEVDGVIVYMTTSDNEIDDVVSDARLVVDGEVYDDFALTGGTSTQGTYDFDTKDEDFVIDAGDEVTVEVQVEFAKLSGNYSEGTTIQATTTANNLDAEGADDLENTAPDQLTGSSNGETHTLRTSGLIIEPGDTDFTFVENSDATTTDNEGAYTLEFEVTAFGSDFYVDNSAASGTADSGTQGVNFVVLDGADAVIVTAEPNGLTSNLSSTANLTSSRFEVNEGETETFTLSVDVDPATADEGEFIKLRLHSVNYKADGTNDNPDTYQTAEPEADFETNAHTI